MNEMLQERCDWRNVPMRVDRQAGIIRGVKLLGLSSRNQRRYLPEALAQAVALYEDAKVNVNHPKGNPQAPRDYQDRIGAIRGVVHRPGEGLFGDFHFNPRHPLAEQLLWDAEHAPENVGFSHNVEARVKRQEGVLIVEEIVRVQSVDLVADPASTRGLFESAAGEPEPPAVLANLTLEQFRRQRPDLVAAISSDYRTELARLREEVSRLESAQTRQQRLQSVRRLLREFHLPDPDALDARGRPLVGAWFLDALLKSPDEVVMREMVEEHVRLAQSLRGAAGAGKPLAREPEPACTREPLDVKKFVAAIT